MEKKIILNHSQIVAKFNRLAQHLYEEFFEEELLIIGIGERGFLISKEIETILKSKFSTFNFRVVQLSLNKKNSQINQFAIESFEVPKNSSICLIDDVVDSGKTIFYCLAWLQNFIPKQIKTLTLVDRNHRKFPIKADFIGLELSTTFNDVVIVEFIEQNWNAYLESK